MNTLNIQNLNKISFNAIKNVNQPILYTNLNNSNNNNLDNSIIDNKENFVRQDGKTVFKNAVFNMADVAVKMLERNNLTKEDVDWLAAHQANKRIIEATANRIEVDSTKVMMNIEKYGNTTSATLPLCLFEYEKKLKKGDKLVFAAFGGGFTWGAMYLTWSYDS